MGLCWGPRWKEAEATVEEAEATVARESGATVARVRSHGSLRETWSQSGEEVRLEGEEAARVSRGWRPEGQALQGDPSEQAS